MNIHISSSTNYSPQKIPFWDDTEKERSHHVMLWDGAGFHLLPWTAPLPHFTFSALTGDVAVTSLWEERAGQMERKRGSRQPSASAQIILTPEAAWQVSAAHFSGLGSLGQWRGPAAELWQTDSKGFWVKCRLNKTYNIVWSQTHQQSPHHHILSRFCSLYRKNNNAPSFPATCVHVSHRGLCCG